MNKDGDLGKKIEPKPSFWNANQKRDINKNLWKFQSLGICVQRYGFSEMIPGVLSVNRSFVSNRRIIYNPIIIQSLIVFIIILFIRKSFIVLPLTHMRSMFDSTNYGCDVLSYRATLLLMCLQQDPMSNSLGGPNNESNDSLHDINLYVSCVVFFYPVRLFQCFLRRLFGLRNINLEINPTARSINSLYVL